MIMIMITIMIIMIIIVIITYDDDYDDDDDDDDYDDEEEDGDDGDAHTNTCPVTSKPVRWSVYTYQRHIYTTETWSSSWAIYVVHDDNFHDFHISKPGDCKWTKLI